MDEHRDTILNPHGQPVSPLVCEVMERYGIERGEIEFLREGAWSYASERSAVVAVETSQRTRTSLEYGANGDSTGRIEHSELHYIHIFFLKELHPDAEYSLRITARDRSGEIATSEVMTLRTRTLSDAIRIPAQIPGPPYILDRQNAHYLLTEEITAPGTALEIAASGITLDLGGHRATYDEEHHGLVETRAEDPACGIRIPADIADIHIFNGTILQGQGQDQADEETLGFNPIFLHGTSRVEIAGVECVYAGVQLSGIACVAPGPDIRIHHALIEDRGKLIANRHKMCCAIRLDSTEGGTLYNNLIKRARQSALGNLGKKVDVHHNELHIDSYSINSFGIGVKDDSTVRHNRIFGCGDNVVALATTGGCKHIELRDNYIWLQAHDIAAYQPYLNDKEMESSPYSIMSGVRITWGCDDVDYRDNTILVAAREGGYIRGTFLYNDANVHAARFRDNLVVAIAEDEQSHGWGAIAGVGNETRGAVEPMLFSGNTIVSNFANFNMQDSYGVSLNYSFVDNTFVRVGDRPDYATIRAREGRPSKGHLFLENYFEGGAGYDRLDIGPEDEFEIYWAIQLKEEPGAKISLTDREGKTHYTGEFDENGELSVPLPHFRQRGPELTRLTPYTARIESGGATRTLSIVGPEE